MDKLQNTVNILKEYKQDHIIRLLEKLNKEQQDELIKQIATTALLLNCMTEL